MDTLAAQLTGTAKVSFTFELYTSHAATAM